MDLTFKMKGHEKVTHKMLSEGFFFKDSFEVTFVVGNI